MPCLPLAFSRLCCPPVLVLLAMCYPLPSFTPEAMKRLRELQGMFVRLERSCESFLSGTTACCLPGDISLHPNAFHPADACTPLEK